MAAGVAAVLPQASGYLSSEIGRRLVLHTTDRLFAAVTRLPRAAAVSSPLNSWTGCGSPTKAPGWGGSTVTGPFATGRAVGTLVGFVGSLLAFSPLMTGIVIGAAVPALVAHVQLSRWRAGIMWAAISPTDRWQFVYSQVDAAKEIRLSAVAGSCGTE